MSFRWGTFCREIWVDAGTQQTMTLVGVLPVVNLVAEVDKEDTFDFPLSVWVHAVFDFNDSLEEGKPFKITTRFQFEEQDPVIQELPLVRGPGQDLISLNLQMDPSKALLKLKSGRFLARMSFRYKTTDLGMIELPFVVTVNTK